ncbi:hypothetical protein Sa4125_18530 [Aureimonas sp. SA4125]|uniref:hypothetical protein n=1 Tax=Aureimonas sp. SA4125 TaxID=2826993 RepID=UPI001CC3BC48|nr:hypothetical protein [Aureimonas sp. SA4125]BDA84311.1 hypothetical protein Sa4125_18530 [Aureimonas sp. SA4125]
MAPYKNEFGVALHQIEGPRLDITLAEFGDSMLHRLQRQNSALEKLRQALDDDCCDDASPRRVTQS